MKQIEITKENCIAITHPQIAAQWHPTKNKELTPYDVTAGSEKKVWWYLPYDDPQTGKHFDFEWQAAVYSRTGSQSSSCPFLSTPAHSVWYGFNDLETAYPDLSKEWHPTKNGNLKPSDVTYGSNAKVWWYLPYDDPTTGKHFDFEWQDTVSHRTKMNRGCPFISNQKVYKGYNDLETTYPELAQEWHPTKNGDLKPSEITYGSRIKVWWYLPYDDPQTGKHFDFEWQAVVYSRTGDKVKSCPFLSIPAKSVWHGFNDFETVYPKLAKEWHPTKNGDLKPSDVLSGSGKIVWWYLPYDDPKTGKHFDFEWQASVVDRTKKNFGCPYISGQRIYVGFNDLETLKPELAKEWHPTKNGKLKPSEVSISSEKKVWWYLPYDDPTTGKHFDFEWQAVISTRAVKNIGCPYLSSKKATQGVNDLATILPELAKEWHPTKNGNNTPDDFTIGSHKIVWWYLPYDDPKTGKHFDFEWKSSIHARVRNGKIQQCPYLVGKKVWSGYNDLASKMPMIAEEWNYEKNRNLTPEQVSIFSERKVWWKCLQNHEWRTTIHSRTFNGSGCPYCYKNR